MRIFSNIVGALLGLMFIAGGVAFLFNLVPPPKDLPPAGTPVGDFMAAFGPTGYMTFVKIFEVIGGLLIAIPKTRRAGLLVLGPIIINILAFHGFVAKEGLFSPMLLVIVAMTLFLVWIERAAFAQFLFAKACRVPETSTEPATAEVAK